MASITNIELILETIQNQQKVYNVVVNKALSAGDIDAVKVTKAEKSIKKMDGFISLYLNSVDRILKVMTAQYAGSKTLSEALGYVEEVTDDNGDVIKKGGYKNIEAIQAVFQLYSGLSKSIETIAKLEIDRKTSKAISKKGEMIASVLENSIDSMIDAFQSIDKSKLQSMMDILTTEPSTITHIANSSKAYQPGDKNLAKEINNVKDITQTGRMGLLDVFDKVLAIMSTFLGMTLPNPIGFVIKVKVWGLGVKFVFKELFAVINSVNDPKRIKVVAQFATTTEKLNEALTNIMMIDSTITMISKKLLGHMAIFKLARWVALPSFVKIICKLLNLPAAIAGEGGDPNASMEGASAFIEKLTPVISSIQGFVDAVKDLSKSLLYFNIARVLLLRISMWGVKIVLRGIIHKDKKGNYVGLLPEMMNFAEATKEVDLEPAIQAINSVKELVKSIKTIVGDIFILGLLALPLMVAVPIALLSLVFIKWFIKGAIKVIDKISTKKQYTKMVTSVENIAKIVGMMLLMVLMVLGTLIVISLAVPLLIKSAKQTLIAFAVIALITFVIAGLAVIINKILSKIEAAWDGLLMMIALIGTMLLVAGVLMLFTLMAQWFFEDDHWLYALEMFGVVAVVVLAIGGLGYLIAYILPGIASFAAGVVLVAIAITAMLLIGGELLLLAEFDFDEAKRNKIKTATASIIGAAKSVIDGLFYGFDKKDNPKQSNNGPFVSFFKSIFKGATFVIQALTASIVFVLTVVSVTMMLLIGYELEEIVKIKIDKDTVTKQVDTIMGVANAVIDAIFEPGETQENSEENPGGSRFIGTLKHIFTGLVDIIEVIVSIGKMALIMIAIGMIRLIGGELNWIVNFDTSKTGDATKNTQIIMSTANAVVDAIFDPGQEKPENEKGGKFLGFIKSAFKNIAGVIESVVGIGRMGPTLAAVGMVALLARELQTINDISNTVNKQQILDNTDLILGVSDDIVKKVFDTTTGFDIDEKKIEKFNKLTNSLEDFIKVSNKKADNLEKNIDNTIKFVDKIDSVKLESLQTATNMFEKMAEFSKSIGGNFEGLANTINDKIMPLLEELNDSLDKTNKSIEGGAFSQPVTYSVPTGGGSDTGGGASGAAAPGRPAPPPKDYSRILGEIKQEITKVQKTLTDGSQITTVKSR